MAKSKKRKTESKKSSQVTTESSSLGHNPFGGLSSLGQSLPDGPGPNDLVTQASPAKPPARPASSEFSQKLVVRREVKGRSGKTVTRISGIRKGSLKPVAKTMKKALGCGAVVEGDDIVLLGSLVDRASEWLSKAGADKVVKGN